MPDVAEFHATINGVEVSSFDEGLNILRDIQTAVKQANRPQFLQDMKERKEADKAAREQAPGTIDEMELGADDVQVIGEGGSDATAPDAAGDAAATI